MPEPILGSFGERMYEALTPITGADASLDWPLKTYIGAIAGMFQPIEDLAADTPDGHVGWSILLDADRIPDDGLEWYSQLVGVRFVSGQDPVVQRARVKATDGWNRGTVSSIVEAVRSLLTGNKTVILVERDTSAYHFLVRTRIPETPDQAAVLAAIQMAKPAGLQFTYEAVPDWTYDDLDAAYASYDAIDAAYATYDDIDENDPI